MSVQYIGGCSVHRGVFSTSGGIQYIGGYHDYIGDIMSTSSLVHRRDIMMHVGDIMIHVGDTKSTPGDVQYIGGYHEYSEGYHEYIGGYHEYIGGYHDACGGILWCMWGIPKVHQGMFSTLEDAVSTAGISWVHLGDIMMHVGEQVDKILSISIENPNVLKSLDVLLISPKVFMISPWYTHGIPLMYWTSPMHSWYPSMYWTPWCTHDIPTMYSWYPPMYSWCPPDVLNTPTVLKFPRCTEHTLYRVILMQKL